MARRASGLALVAAGSLLLAGWFGAVDCGDSRFRSVSARNELVTISGFADSASSWVCAYQQTKDGTAYSAIVACALPDGSSGTTDSCGVTWYPWDMSFYLLSSDYYWFGSHNTAGGTYEYTRIFPAQYGVANGGLYTSTGDFDRGPSDDTTCFRSQIADNAAVAPITYFRGGVPADLECSSGENSYAGCPFTCNLTRGCDSAYGVTQNEFNLPAYRTNSSGQSTALTRFDHYGPNAYYGAPSGDWSYMVESGTCYDSIYGGMPCEGDYECYHSSTPWGWCGDRYWTVMRRNSVTYDSLNIRRGENRRNSQIESWVRTKFTTDSQHREIGLTSRFYNADNYFVFMLTEYGGDYARIQGYNGGGFYIHAQAWPYLDLRYWTRLGFEISDYGSYANDRFVPSGYCGMRGFVNNGEVIRANSVYCANAPYGNYGTFTYYMRDAMFWDLDAYPR